MKKALLAAFAAGLLAFTACDIVEFGAKTPVETPSKDAGLTGEQVDVAGIPADVRKVFVLNEGGMGANNATLDFLRVSDGNYVTGAFKKMNPGTGAGLGDVGNDIAVCGDEVWIVVNNSGIVEVLSAKDETEIAAITVPTPRYIAFDDKYAYVTSWAGAYANGNYDAGYYAVTDYKNPKGQVYRINLASKKLEGSVEVGYQPEDIACHDGKLYVANSGGIASQLPPDYAYDNTVSIIDTKLFQVVGSQVVQVNLKNVYSDGKGTIYVTTLGNFWDVHSGLYLFPASDPSRVSRAGERSAIRDDQLHVSCSCILGDTVYCIGTEDEFDWSGPHTYYAWSVTVSDVATGEGKFSLYPLRLTGTPYGMAVVGHASSLDIHDVLVGDAGDYFNPGTVSLYSLDYNDNARLWSVTSGVCPGHFAIW